MSTSISEQFFPAQPASLTKISTKQTSVIASCLDSTTQNQAILWYEPECRVVAFSVIPWKLILLVLVALIVLIVGGRLLIRRYTERVVGRSRTSRRRYYETSGILYLCLSTSRYFIRAYRSSCSLPRAHGLSFACSHPPPRGILSDNVHR